MLSSARLILGFRKPWQILTLLVVAWCGIVLWAAAQQPALQPPAPSTVQPPDKAPQLPHLPQRSPQGADAVNKFVKDLTTTDSVFEVFVGQSRILTLKEDLAEAPKKGDKQLKGIIAVGDPTIIDFDGLNVRQLRIIGLRLGVTDFSISTKDNRIFNFEVRVVADVQNLNAQLARLFPNAKNVKVSQIRDHLIVEGEATDTREADGILDTVERYLDSVYASQILTKAEGRPQPERAKAHVISRLREPIGAHYKLLQDQLSSLFPEAKLKLTQVHEVKGLKERGSASQSPQNLSLTSNDPTAIKQAMSPTASFGTVTLVVEGVASSETERTKILAIVQAAKVQVVDLIRLAEPNAQEMKMRQAERESRERDRLNELQAKLEASKAKFKRELKELEGRLHELFPDASITLSNVRDNDVIVAGQARDSLQVNRILATVDAYLSLHKVELIHRVLSETNLMEQISKIQTGIVGQSPLNNLLQSIPQPKVVNLLRVPGPQQVLLKVRIAELNRTALRQIGSAMQFTNDRGTGVVGTNPGQLGTNSASSALTNGTKTLSTLLQTATNTTAFGIFNKDFDILLSALRKNDVLRVLAEPNLVAMNGHQANFLAGGKFPVPVPQPGGGANSITSVTVQFQDFGVKLAFVPQILDSGAIRLQVDPEVSSIDFSIGTTIAGTTVPGLNIRSGHTTVEIREGQTLAMAGLLSVTLEGSTARIPGLGDVPILGPFFSNTSSKRTEKELIVLVTPYLIDSMRPEQVPPTPGCEVGEPNDLELYLGNRIEGRRGDFRSTTRRYTTAPAMVPTYLRLHDEYVRGPHGFSD